MSVVESILSKFRRLLNLVKRLNKLIGKSINPIIEVLLNIDESSTDLSFPNLDESHIRSVVNHSLTCHLFDAFELFLVEFVLFVEVDETFIVEDAKITLPFVFLFGEENSWPLMLFAI